MEVYIGFILCVMASAISPVISQADANPPVYDPLPPVYDPLPPVYDPLPPVYDPPPPGHPVIYHTNLTDQFVVTAVHYINAFYRQQGDTQPRVPVKVVNATVQAVNGYLYWFEIELTAGVRHEVCDVRVLSKPWQNMTSQLGSPLCNYTNHVTDTVNDVIRVISTRQLPDPVPASMFDPKVQKAYVVVEEQVNRNSSASHLLRAGAAATITKQKLNGAIFSFVDLNFYVTSCLKNLGLDITDCPHDQSATPRTVCTAHVWWCPTQFPEYQVISTTCT